MSPTHPLPSFFFFNDTATTEIYTLSLHDALPICPSTMPRPVILVVDDDPGVRESFRLILEDHYDVLDVPDGPRALEVVRSAQVDLVLLDIRLPDMDGIEVLERTKAIDEGIEVILVTAVKTVRTAVAAMKLRSEEHTSELQSRLHLVCRLLL